MCYTAKITEYFFFLGDRDGNPSSTGSDMHCFSYEMWLLFNYSASSSAASVGVYLFGTVLDGS